MKPIRKENKDNKAESFDETGTIVVGIGASAGGLEALQDFFKAVPLNSGLAYVVIQHLSPDYKSLMDELLARHTRLPIQIISDGLQIQPDNIYLIPPRKNLRIFKNKLFLEEQNLKKGLNLPIDIFFRSLAEEKGKNAVGIILSGTGSDGTLGTRAIKETGGMIMVQDDQSAKFDGMPRSSIATGLVDYILPPQKMPEALLEYTKHPFVRKDKTLESILSKNIDTLTKIIMILRDYSGIDFSYYKENTIIRRLERRVSINRFDTLEEYLIFLSESDKEKDTLYRELLIGVTRFFRDMDAFGSFQKKVIPKLVARNKESIRIWSVGCSTGEEVYSVAMIMMEYLSQNNLNTELKIFATDIDRHAIEVASQGYYPDSIVADIDPYLLTRYFNRRENGYQVNETLRRMVVFATHNLLKDPPFSKLDLLVCRNLFIYLKPEMQQRLLSMFYYSLGPEGYLFMGSSETIGEMSEAFHPIDSKWKIYQYAEGFKPPLIKDLPAARPGKTESELLHGLRPRFNESIKAEKLLEGVLALFLPPTVIVDENANIVQVVNDINKFIKLPSGRFTQNLVAILPGDLALFVNNLLRRLKGETGNIVFENITGLAGFEKMNVTLEGRVVYVEKTRFYAISFRTKDKKAAKKDTETSTVDIEKQVNRRLHELEKELQMTKENLQATVEELETSNEELQSSNEELIASNEELQSTNEELQSVNEELYTVNSEYQSKIDELIRLNSDLDNLLRNTDVGALYLDSKLCIRKITPVVSKITNILPSDIGRPISHLSVMTHYEDLLQDIQQVMETLQAVDKEVTNDSGQVFFARIRPYRTENNAVEGILVTFVDITLIKEMESQVGQMAQRLHSAMNIGNMAWWEWDISTGRVTFDPKKATMIGYTVREFPTDVYEICNLIHPDDYEKTMQIMRDHLEGRTGQWEATYRIKRKDNTYAWYFDRGIISEYDASGKPLRLIGTVLDISRLKQMEKELLENKHLFEKVLENSPMAKFLLDASGKITYANRQAETILGIPVSKITTLHYDSAEWNHCGPSGEPIPAGKLPFDYLRKHLKPLTAHKHYLKTSAQEIRPILIYASPIFQINGDFDGAVIGISTDQF